MTAITVAAKPEFFLIANSSELLGIDQYIRLIAGPLPQGHPARIKFNTD
jgi:hypothetical protein